MMQLIGIHDPLIVDALATVGIVAVFGAFVFALVTAVVADLDFFRRVKITAKKKEDWE